MPSIEIKNILKVTDTKEKKEPDPAGMLITDLYKKLKVLKLREKIGSAIKRMSAYGEGYIRIFKFDDMDNISIANPHNVIYDYSEDSNEILAATMFYYQNIGHKKFIRTEK